MPPCSFGDGGLTWCPNWRPWPPCPTPRSRCSTAPPSGSCAPAARNRTLASAPPPKLANVIFFRDQYAIIRLLNSGICAWCTFTIQSTLINSFIQLPYQVINFIGREGCLKKKNDIKTSRIAMTSMLCLPHQMRSINDSL